MQLPRRSLANLLTLSQPVSVRFDFPSLFLTHYAFDQFPKINTNYPLYYSTGTSHKWRSHRILSSVLETFSFLYFRIAYLAKIRCFHLARVFTVKRQFPLLGNGRKKLLVGGCCCVPPVSLYSSAKMDPASDPSALRPDASDASPASHASCAS